jgi:ribosomal protein S18 acetylase RimI-like enzyme
MRVEELGPGDEDAVLAAAHLFDSPPSHEWTRRFLETETHHLLIAFEDDAPAGFVTGVETTHPDKGTEMFLYELSVDERLRRRGIGTGLVRALGVLAQVRGCYAMWVATEPDNDAALAAYRSAGASEPVAAVVLEWKFDAAQ